MKPGSVPCHTCTHGLKSRGSSISANCFKLMPGQWYAVTELAHDEATWVSLLPGCEIYHVARINLGTKAVGRVFGAFPIVARPM